MPRPRLHAQLDQACTDLPIVTVIAGAGFGKTTLLSCWADQVGDTGDADVIWIDAGDADSVPGGTLQAVRSALGAEGHGPLSTVPDGSRPADPRPSTPTCPEHQRERIVILDDLQNVRSRRTFTTLDRLLRHPPSGVTFVLVSRWEPLLQLSRLRAEGRVADFSADELAMTPEEIGQVFETRDVALDDESLTHIVEMTQGWPVGVRLACVAVASGGAPEDLRGDDGQVGRLIGRYLADEVFDRLPSAWQDVLRSISILEQVHVDLASDLSGNDLAPTVLEEVAAQTGLFTPLPAAPGWFRTHQLAKAHLRTILEADGPRRIADLHDRAARWFAERGDLASALPHAIGSRNEMMIRSIVQQTGLSALLCSEASSIRMAREIAATAPAVWPNGRPLVLAVAVLTSVDPPAAAALLDTVDPSALHSVEDRRLWAIARCRVLRNQARNEEARAALDTVSWLGAQPTEIALRDSEFALAGVSDESYEQLTRRAESALTLARSIGADRPAVHLRVALSVLALARGQPRDAKRQAHEALSLGHLFGPEQELVEAQCAHDAATLELGEDADHDLCCTISSPWNEPGGPVHLLVAGTTTNLHYRWRTGELPRPLLDRLDRILGSVEPDTIYPAFLFAAALLEVRLAEASQDLQRVRQATTRLPTRYACTAEAHVLRAEEQRVRRDHRRGRDELRPVLRGEVPTFWGSTRLLAFTLDAVLAHLDGSSDTGSLQEAVEIAHATGRRGPFIDLGAAMCETLVAHRAALPSYDGFVEELIEAVHQREPVRLPEPLTGAEMRVLRRLDSMATLQEIAAGLNLSRNTVKTHAAAVYRKLDAPTRREAIARARTLGLLGAHLRYRREDDFAV